MLENCQLPEKQATSPPPHSDSEQHLEYSNLNTSYCSRQFTKPLCELTPVSDLTSFPLRSVARVGQILCPPKQGSPQFTRAEDFTHELDLRRKSVSSTARIPEPVRSQTITKFLHPNPCPVPHIISVPSYRHRHNPYLNKKPAHQAI